MSIGIIVATNQEMEETRKRMKDIIKKEYYNLIFVIGKISGKDVVLVKCGIGKVNAARTTQILIDKFSIEKIINIGAAGGISKELNVKDIVIGDQLVQYDFDTSPLGDTQKGEIDGVGKFIKSDEKLISLCKDVLEKMQGRDFSFKVGTIATADFFCADIEKSEETRKLFGAECVEMEGAAIAQVCFLDQIPFLVIRGISDTQNGNNKIDYFSYCNIAAKQAADLLENILENL